jgi:hypothetical protein
MCAKSINTAPQVYGQFCGQKNAPISKDRRAWGVRAKANETAALLLGLRRGGRRSAGDGHVVPLAAHVNLAALHEQEKSKRCEQYKTNN